jgi:Fe-S oxidoreductase
MIDRWTALASVAPGAANALLHAAGIGNLVKKALQLSPERGLPRLAPRDFRSWARRNNVSTVRDAERAAASPRVVLWVDTFNNAFHPDALRAAHAVLLAAGFVPCVPAARLCCGRPLYDFGLLEQAKRYLSRVLEALGPCIDRELPVVVLEPSCASVFRDELRNLFPDDPRAERLSRQTYVLSEFLEKRAPGYRPAQEVARDVLLHGHCHQKALMKMTHEEALLRASGARVHAPDAGCCGMAGPFGFLAEKYDVAQAVGERVLLPAVRASPADTLIVADGFSCREQILHATGRRAIHVAEVLSLGI